MLHSAHLRRLWIAATSIAVLALAARPAFAFADDAKQVFDSLFAGKIKTVAATIDRADDFALAKDMLALAKTSTNQPALLALLCDAAHDLATKHADGFSTGVEAQQLLADTVDEKRAAAREKLVALLTRQSTAGKPDEREPAGEKLIDLLMTMGDEKAEKKQYPEAAGDYRRAVSVATQRKSASLDEVKAKLEWATGRDRTMKRLAQLQEKLLKDADSATAEEIVKVYVVELDDPAGAVPFLDRVKDPSWKTTLALAVKDTAILTEQEAMALGDFYSARAKEAPAAARPTMWKRARDSYDRFLSLHETKDLARTKVEVLLKEIETASVATPSPRAAPTPRGETDLLRLIDVKKDGISASFERGKLVTKGNLKVWSRVTAPVAMTGAYELRVVLTRMSGIEDFSVGLPVGGRHILHVADGWGGATSALHCGGTRQNLIVAPQGARLTTGKTHTMQITVTPDDKGQVRIQSRVDDKPLLEWTGSINDLAMNADEYPGHPANPFLRNSGSTYTIHEFKAKAITGTIELTDHLSITPRAGKWGGARFHEIAPRGGMLVGLRGRAGHLIQSIQPIYRTSSEVVDGRLIRKHADAPFEVVAKDGYAIGALNYRAGGNFDGFEVVFMKVKGNRLDPKDSYKSSWVGGKGGSEGKFDGEGDPIVGIHGGTGVDFDGMGVIFRR